jgi:hypothetical protein
MIFVKILQKTQFLNQYWLSPWVFHNTPLSEFGFFLEKSFVSFFAKRQNSFIKLELVHDKYFFILQSLFSLFNQNNTLLKKKQKTDCNKI